MAFIQIDVMGCTAAVIAASFAATTFATAFATGTAAAAAIAANTADTDSVATSGDAPEANCTVQLTLK